MQKDIHNEDYFGTLMSVLVDEARRLCLTENIAFNPSPTAYAIQEEMCQAGCWVSKLPNGPTTNVHNEPQQFVLQVQKDVLPEYRMQAARLIQHFVDACIREGLKKDKVITHFEKLYKWRQ